MKFKGRIEPEVHLARIIRERRNDERRNDEMQENKHELKGMSKPMKILMRDFEKGKGKGKGKGKINKK